jgi:hypothetical protein
MNSYVNPLTLPDISYMNKYNVHQILKNINHVIEYPHTNNVEPYKIIDLINLRSFIYQNIDIILSRG